jgi:hypothetical protein
MIPLYRLRAKHDGRCPACDIKLSITPKTIELRQLVEKGIIMVYRKTLGGPWICSWNCGFRDYDIKKVIEHENKGEH